MRRFTLLFLLMLVSVISYAQDITGRVLDNAGAPLPGVTVIIQGSNSGDITDIEGKFEVKDVKNDDVLEFAFMGFTPQAITVGTQTNITVTMVADAMEMEEVVVVGYGVQKKALVTGANSNVNGDKISELKPSTAMEALQGVVPGLNITRNNGAPGSGTKVTIRGMGTIGNSNPLFIVDGVAVGDINYLSPSDIESVDVLKDAASSAIYGARAANGVVLVTTKRGKASDNGETTRSITYDGYMGFQNVYKKVPALNAQEYMYIIDEARANEGIPAFDWQNMIVNGNNYVENTFGNNQGVEYGQYVWDKLESGWTGTDWMDEITSADAPVTNHSISITGNNKDFIYSAGFSYLDQKSIIGGDIMDAGYKRITARLNTELVVATVGDRKLFTLGENLTFTNSQNRSVASGNLYYNDVHNAFVQSPLLPLHWDNENVAAATGGYTPGLEGISNNIINPVAQMFYRSNYNYGRGNNIVGNVYGLLEPIKNLKIRSSFGLNAWSGHSRSWTPTYKLGTLFQNTVDAAQQDMYQGADITWTNTATYDFTIKDDHDFSVLIGSEMLKNQLNFNVGGRKANTLFGDPNYSYIDNTTNPESVTEIGTWGKDWAAQGGGLLSYMGRLSYNYQGKYMADVTFRADGSSNFAKGNRWGYFPSLSFGWNFTEESFMKDVKFLNFGKLRASWGQNGNHNINNFVYSSNIAYKPQGYYFGSNKEIPSIGAVPANVPNPDVSWETSEQLNIGLDLRMLHSRLSLTMDWYNKTTKDWLVIAPILGTFGAGAPYINGGDVKNSGFEFSAGWNDTVGDFSYGATLTGAANKNEVTRIANAEGVINGNQHELAQGTSFVSRVEVGKPIGFFYGYETDGLFQNQDDVDQYVTAEGNPILIGGEETIARRPGDVKFVDQNSDGLINEDDKVMIGKPNPSFEMGLQLNVGYKGFYANTTLTGKFGMQVMQSYRSFSDHPFENYTTQIFNRWHGEGTSNKVPRLNYTSNANANLISDVYMHNADYMRVSNLTVGYQFDSLLKNVKAFKGASVYCTVNNLHTFTSYQGMDPEVGYASVAWGSGIDLGLYPLPRTVIFGVNLTF